ncbi:MAG: protein-glutamate O-methyltransferase CheR [bacterium]|nr:protein-glutamate O-methyltransferase CheR [bacterium]
MEDSKKRGYIASDISAEVATVISDDAFLDIRNLLFERSTLDINNYKDKCIKRRIAVRVRANGCKTAEEYIDLLKRRTSELENLLKTLTINVTQFFRNPFAFDEIRKDIFPLIFKKKADEQDSPLKIWSVGCSSGEEPYTLAIILKEYFKKELMRFPAVIVATDFDAEVIAKAREGIYHKKSLEEVPVHLKEKYFIPLTGGNFRITSQIKEMVTFKKRNILQDELREKQDLIICRNMLIYFSREQQGAILDKLTESLTMGGFLVLGKAETLVSNSRNNFKTVSSRERIYQKINF